MHDDSDRTDELIQLAAWAEMRRPDSPFYTDHRFIEWQARELASPERRREGWSAERIDAMARRLLVRVASRQGRIVLARDAPAPRQAPVVAVVTQVLAEAARDGWAPRVDLAAAAGAGRELWDEPCDEWVRVPPEVPAGQHVSIRVAGNSMDPLLHDGDTVLVRVGTAAEPGTTVLARLPDDGYVIKRVGRLTARRIELLSHNDAFAPLAVARRPDSIAGTVVLRWCPHGE